MINFRGGDAGGYTGVSSLIAPPASLLAPRPSLLAPRSSMRILKWWNEMQLMWCKPLTERPVYWKWQHKELWRHRRATVESPDFTMAEAEYVHSKIASVNPTLKESILTLSQWTHGPYLQSNPSSLDLPLTPHHPLRPHPHIPSKG